MVEEQLTARGITNSRVLAAMNEVPRHLFVDEVLKTKAYSDQPLPIGAGQTISQPYVIAIMLESLRLADDDVVLEVGTGSGYQAAVLSRLCHRIYTVERINPLLTLARKAFSTLHYYNIRSQLSDGTLGWPENSPYDAIIVAAGSPEIPEPLVEQLAEGGRMIVPVGDKESQQLQLVEKNDGEVSVTPLSPVRFVDLVGEYGWRD
ncbi:MAG: protein-L-isoaspartate O-methyltransferase [Deltaproteobacteria bacterium]|nr:MAG: protein-L-isoaspartate O-methyltransferase [Deltaproteobacteria bacterium]